MDCVGALLAYAARKVSPDDVTPGQTSWAQNVSVVDVQLPIVCVLLWRPSTVTQLQNLRWASDEQVGRRALDMLQL